MPGFAPGAIFRTSQAQVQAGGKGLNVARAAHALGLPVRAMALIAGDAGRYFMTLAAREPFPCQGLSLWQGETRTATLILHPPQESTVINESGPTPDAAAWDRLGETLLAEDAALIAFSGSVPGERPDGAAFGGLLDRLLAAGRRVAVDSSGDPLRAALGRPLWLLKINAAELGGALGESLSGRAALVAAARRVCAGGPEWVLVTDGARGACLVGKEGAWWATPPPIEAVNSVGAGDSALAGFCRAMLDPLSAAAAPDALRWAIAAGTVDTLSNAPGVVTLREVEQVAARVQVSDLSG